MATYNHTYIPTYLDVGTFGSDPESCDIEFAFITFTNFLCGDNKIPPTQTGYVVKTIYTQHILDKARMFPKTVSFRDVIRQTKDMKYLKQLIQKHTPEFCVHENLRCSLNVAKFLYGYTDERIRHLNKQANSRPPQAQKQAQESSRTSDCTPNVDMPNGRHGPSLQEYSYFSDLYHHYRQTVDIQDAVDKAGGTRPRREYPSGPPPDLRRKHEEYREPQAYAQSASKGAIASGKEMLLLENGEQPIDTPDRNEQRIRVSWDGYWLWTLNLKNGRLMQRKTPQDPGFDFLIRTPKLRTEVNAFLAELAQIPGVELELNGRKLEGSLYASGKSGRERTDPTLFRDSPDVCSENVWVRYESYLYEIDDYKSLSNAKATRCRNERSGECSKSKSRK
ncbi:hypothetical protein EJ04DRAFT_562735 [Polyplosphaeria fusca]|uniref:Uncharacterized protein n=1 Tax=Polyplosphaeria fusca TaxID=682080 RepID=A0A9P4R3B9_9PLEO|nr:hypothetical protein EJ04DRAFT_562735 [Polyplosphaeria fusca]